MQVRDMHLEAFDSRASPVACINDIDSSLAKLDSSNDSTAAAPLLLGVGCLEQHLVVVVHHITFNVYL